MNPGHPESPAPLDAGAEATLRAATTALRDHIDRRWVEVADAVVSRALTASRPSWPVRAQAPGGPLQIAEQVLVAYLCDSIDSIADCEVANVHVDTDGDRCTGVVIALAVRYGTALIPLADRVRQVAEMRFEELLGSVVPPVTVSMMHVHVADVTREDPKLKL